MLKIFRLPKKAKRIDMPFAVVRFRQESSVSSTACTLTEGSATYNLFLTINNFFINCTHSIITSDYKLAVIHIQRKYT